MNQPKVSVIVPVYNTEKYLVKCLDSLVNQTLQEIEIIVIDDGSTDSSPQIIKAYSEKYPEKFVCVTQKNSGQAVARNQGVEMCIGEYIGFLDSDDEATPKMFEKMYNEAIRNHVDLVVCDYWFITKRSQQERKVKAFKDRKSMLVDVFVDPWNKLYKSKVLKNNGIKFPEGYFYEDTGWFACTVPFVNSTSKIDEFLVYHYKREGSSMTTLDDKRVAHIFPVMDNIINFYKEKNVYQEFYSELEYFYTKILLCSSMMRIARVKDRKIRRELIIKTFAKINDNFPQYKMNPYFQGRKIEKYIKCISRGNSGLFLAAFSLRNVIKEMKEKW